jgi:hypothetical protein
LLRCTSPVLAWYCFADPKHERHRGLKEWFADDFNPHVIDVDGWPRISPRSPSAGRANPPSSAAGLPNRGDVGKLSHATFREGRQ